MATQLTIVNSILERLREDTVASVNADPYAKLIARFVSDAKEDMEDLNHEWSVYVDEVDTTILNDGTRTYDITSTSDRSWLMRDPENDQLPLAYDISSGEEGQLFDINLKALRKTRALHGTTNDDSTRPNVFAVAADADGRGWTIEMLWELTSTESNRTWRTYWYTPQADLAFDGTDDNTEILLPRRPVELRAYYYALNERGEEMGEPGGIGWTRSVEAIGAAMEVDAVVQKKSDEIDITNKENI